MRPTETVVTSTIPATIQTVFDLLSNAELMPSWMPGCRSVTTKTRFYKGARFVVKFGDNRSTQFEIIDFNSPTTLGWSERGARSGWKTFIQLQFAGGSTTITLREVWAPSSIGDWLRGKLGRNRRATKQFFEAAVQNIRKALTG